MSLDESGGRESIPSIFPITNFWVPLGESYGCARRGEEEVASTTRLESRERESRRELTCVLLDALDVWLNDLFELFILNENLKWTGADHRRGSDDSSSLLPPHSTWTESMASTSAYQLLNPSVPGGPDKRKVAYYYDGKSPSPSSPPFSLTQLTLSLTHSRWCWSICIQLGWAPPSLLWLNESKANNESENFSSSSDETSSNKDGSQLDHELWTRETNGRTRKLSLLAPVLVPTELMKEFGGGQ